jgi:hypothetical protein
VSLLPLLLLAAAAAPDDPAFAHVVSVGGFTNATLASFNSGASSGPTLGWLGTHGPFGVGGGLRVGVPSSASPVPVELYVRAVFTARIGPWEPLLGPELGVSGLATLAPSLAKRPTDFADVERGLHGPFYVAMHTEAARFRFGRFLLSVLGVDVGTSLGAAGTVLRLQLEPISVGVRW